MGQHHRRSILAQIIKHRTQNKKKRKTGKQSRLSCSVFSPPLRPFPGLPVFGPWRCPIITRIIPTVGYQIATTVSCRLLRRPCPQVQRGAVVGGRRSAWVEQRALIRRNAFPISCSSAYSLTLGTIMFSSSFKAYSMCISCRVETEE